ncbi:hypothetical protein Cni_G12394 [Canna indica]|uniref:Uncharacterized protein n=1 Tax=Canna indica TaxID=4628 RepID=A0AAQ3QAJ0_9LILI|nr:hypothetical protein Cni_G12394 [Canna indica]
MKIKSLSNAKPAKRLIHPEERGFRMKEKKIEISHNRPLPILAGRIPCLALLLLLRVLEPPPPLALLDDAGLHHLPLEPPQQDLLRLVVPDHHLRVAAPSLGIENIGPGQRREAAVQDSAFIVC